MIATAYTMEGTPVGLVEHVERETSSGRVGIFARIEVGADVWHLSQLEGEHEWHVDALFGNGWAPVWVHGFGSRVTRPTVVTDPSIVRMLDAAVPPPACEACGYDHTPYAHDEVTR